MPATKHFPNETWLNAGKKPKGTNRFGFPSRQDEDIPLFCTIQFALDNGILIITGSESLPSYPDNNAAVAALGPNKFFVSDGLGEGAIPKGSVLFTFVP